jgi:5'-deoxynucleotidase YfbR-like HD superfamily hydrolase
MSWIQTYTGKAFSLNIIDPNNIDIRDIAHSLSNQCRYNGHCKEFYSVAEHSIEMSMMINVDPMAALLHDAAEAYTGDIITPIKNMLLEFKALENKLNRAIEIRFDLPTESLESLQIQIADKILSATEQRDILEPSKYQWGESFVPLPNKLTPKLITTLIELNFLHRFETLQIDRMYQKNKLQR